MAWVFGTLLLVAIIGFVVYMGWREKWHDDLLARQYRRGEEAMKRTLDQIHALPTKRWTKK